MKILPNTERHPAAGQADYDPGLLIVDLFINEEQEQRVLDEIARELGGFSGSGQRPAPLVSLSLHKTG